MRSRKVCKKCFRIYWTTKRKICPYCKTDLKLIGKNTPEKPVRNWNIKKPRIKLRGKTYIVYHNNKTYRIYEKGMRKIKA